jgi:hypothetical protein
MCQRLVALDEIQDMRISRRSALAETLETSGVEMRELIEKGFTRGG